jgi:hypothetical protein
MFPITMSFTVSTPAELAKLVAATTPAGQGPEMTATEVKQRIAEHHAPKQEVKKADPKPEAPAAASAAQPAATPATPAPTAAPSGGDATIDKAKALTMKIVADKGRDTAVELLKKYGVPVAAKLPADQVAAFCTDAEAVLAS